MRTDVLNDLLPIDVTETWPDTLADFVSPETKVIYSDVDGTLLGPGGCLFKDASHNLTATPANAILKCHLNKIDVVLISGRNSEQLRSDARLLGFTSWIAELGCEIAYNTGEVMLLNIGDYPLSENSVWDDIRASGAPDLLLKLFSNRLEYHVPYSENRRFTHLFRGNVDVEFANSALVDNGYSELRLVDNGPVKRRSAMLDESIKDVYAYHLLPVASGKASAVRKDRETRMIPKEQTAAIGDSVADLELAPEVGALFLVRNALSETPGLEDKIKSYQNVFITRESMGLGWAEAVHFLLGRRG